jgi:hypothetical protein
MLLASMILESVTLMLPVAANAMSRQLAALCRCGPGLHMSCSPTRLHLAEEELQEVKAPGMLQFAMLQTKLVFYIASHTLCFHTLYNVFCFTNKH